MSNFLAYLRIAGWGAVAFVSGALTVDWLGTSWWSRLLACLTVVLTMASVLRFRLEVADGD